MMEKSISLLLNVTLGGILATVSSDTALTDVLTTAFVLPQSWLMLLFASATIIAIVGVMLGKSTNVALYTPFVMFVITTWGYYPSYVSALLTLLAVISLANWYAERRIHARISRNHDYPGGGYRRVRKTVTHSRI